MGILQRIFGKGRSGGERRGAGEFRPGNIYLLHLLAHCKPLDEETKRVIGMIPKVAKGLWTISEQESKAFIDLMDSEGGLTVSDSRSRLTLRATRCFFDLAVAVYSNEIVKFLERPYEGLGLYFGDALLWQGVGEGPGVIREEHIRGFDTHERRGIHKYILTSMIPHGDIKDSAAWMLGQELANIVSGGPNAFIAALVLGPSMLFRWEVRSLARTFLREEEPDVHEREEVVREAEKAKRDAQRIWRQRPW